MALTTNLKATLKSVDSIEVAVYKSYTSSTINFFNLYENNVFVKSLKAISKSESKSSFIYTLAIDYNFQVGKLYEITDDRLERTPLDTNILAKSKDFEKNYRYDGELGALYTKEKTTFRLFSPLASSAFVHLINANSEQLFIPMKRLNEGVYEATIEGDYEKARYTYIVKLNGEFKEVSKEDVLGKWSVFFFYPADFTFVCPTELEDLANKYEEFKNIDCEIYSVSCDTHFVHKAWHDTSKTIQKIQYTMLADPTATLAKDFEVYIEADGLAERGTFIVNPEGKIVAYEVIAGNVGRNADELLRRVQASQFVHEHGDEVCPAKWKPGEETLKPSLDLVGVL